MELRDLRLALRRYWLLAAGVLALCLLIGAAAAFLPSKTYRATSVVFATANTGQGINPAQVADFEIPRIVYKAGTSDFNGRLRADLDPEVTSQVSRVEATNDEGTGIIYIQVYGRDASAVADYATEAATLIIEEQSNDSNLLLEFGESARTPSGAVSPQPAPALLGSAVLGMFLAVLAAVGASRVRQALDVAEEVRVRLRAPVLGQIPPIRRLQRGSESVAAMLEHGPPELVEAFQSLRTNVDLLLLDEHPPAIAVASWSAGEGKSTVAAGLALSLAAVGRDVVMIDADLRRPTQHLRLAEPFGEGLADLGRVEVDKVVRRTRHDHLWYLPAGIPDRHPADVVAVTLSRAHTALAAPDRLLIIDAPPLHGVAETPLVLNVAHYVILVVDASSVKLVELEQSVERLRASGLVLLGVVINRVRSPGQSGTYDSYVVRPNPGLAEGNGFHPAPEDEPTNGSGAKRRSGWPALRRND